MRDIEIWLARVAAGEKCSHGVELVNAISGTACLRDAPPVIQLLAATDGTPAVAQYAIEKGALADPNADKPTPRRRKRKRAA